MVELVTRLDPARLASVLGEQFDDPHVEVRDLERLTAGASRETWAFTVLEGGRARELVLRRDPPGDIREDGIAREAHSILAAATAGVPVPAVVAWDGDSHALGSPFLITERIDGETLGRKIVSDEALSGARRLLAAQCGRVLADIHRIPPEAIPELRRLDPVHDLRALLDSFDERSAAFELALRWLELNRPQEERITVVHGDFRNGNLIVGDDGIRAVLDWELVHLGDPLEDLGYLCVRAWRFGGPGEVGGFGDRSELLAAYEHASGHPVDPAAVKWWAVWGTLRWGVGCLEMCSRHLAGAERSVELAAIGRRSREQEYDLMLMLDQPAGAR
jgi:aminoglycoside phosphotransferase (APT) family kinase protein